MAKNREVDGVELRPITQYGYFGEHGRSSFYVDCPFCGKRRILVYAWSFAGGGKRCPQCRAFLCAKGAFKE